MKKQSLLLPAAALLAGCAASGQLSKADKQYAEGKFEQAIKSYQADVARHQNPVQANFRIGEAYRLSNRLELAVPFYSAALAGQVRDPDAGYRYAQALRAAGQLDEAAAQYAQYAQSSPARPLAAHARAEVQAIEASKGLTGKVAAYDVRPLDALNSPSSDFSAGQRAGSGELVFASGRDGNTYQGNGEGYWALYTNKFDDPVAMTGGTPRRLDPLFNAEKTMQASATYAPDGNTVVFARSNDGRKNGLRSNDLWISFFRNGAWTKPVLANVNDRTADDYAPAFAPDGTTLYFASNRAGGQGGDDLYRATLGADGRFSPVQSLGEPVNTPGNDTFPGLAPDGTLYFASSGHPGLGKLDIFTYQAGQVRNLGPGINSPADDFAPFFTSPGSGVFSSNRAGGKGSDDLYRFEKKPRRLVTYAADGYVQATDDKAAASRPVAHAEVILTSAGGQHLRATTGPDGHFTAKLDSAQTYSLLVERAGYFAARGTLSTVGRSPEAASLRQPVTEVTVPVTLTLNQLVVNKAIQVKDIFYDYNKYAIRPEAALRLDTLAQLLADNQAIAIELSSHTDQRGNAAYNRELSQQRAEAAVAYIVHKGIAQHRITAKGYGESRPLVKNPRTAADYQQNRRTEFKVTRIDY